MSVNTRQAEATKPSAAAPVRSLAPAVLGALCLAAACGAAWPQWEPQLKVGEDVSQQNEPPAEPASPPDTYTPYQPAEDPVVTYLNAIEQAESVGGAYAQELTDLYMGLGAALLQELELEAARDAFHQGVTIMRVNDGPNSLEQTNFLFQIADIETRMGDRRAAGDVMQNIYLISAKNFGEDDPRMLPVLERMYAWYMKTRPLYSPYAQYSDFANSKYLAGRMAYLTERDKGLAHPDTARVNRTLGQINFLTVKYALGRGISVEPGVVVATGSPQPPYIQEISVRDHYVEGTEAFERMVQSVTLNPETTTTERAEALAQLGDWYLVFDKFKSARDQYQAAWQVLADGESGPELADRYMGKPAPVRLMNNFEDFTSFELPEADNSSGIEVSMSVTRSGLLRNIEILKVPEDMTAEQVQLLEAQLKTARFRPAVVNGLVEKVDDYLWSYSMSMAEGMP